MTKQHFIAIAKILKANNAPANIILDFADYFQSINPNFDHARFIEACM